MNNVKERAPSTAATVQSAKTKVQDQNSTVQALCKPSLDLDDRQLRLFDEILEVAEPHYDDGFNGKPFRSKITCAGIAASLAEPTNDEKIKNAFSIIDAMLYEAWKRGQADATAGKYAREALRDEFTIS